MLFLLPRFCASFSLQTLKMMKIFGLTWKIFRHPSCVGLATALSVRCKKYLLPIFDGRPRQNHVCGASGYLINFKISLVKLEEKALSVYARPRPFQSRLKSFDQTRFGIWTNVFRLRGRRSNYRSGHHQVNVNSYVYFQHSCMTKYEVNGDFFRVNRACTQTEACENNRSGNDPKCYPGENNVSTAVIPNSKGRHYLQAACNSR